MATVQHHRQRVVVVRPVLVLEGDGLLGAGLGGDGVLHEVRAIRSSLANKGTGVRRSRIDGEQRLEAMALGMHPFVVPPLWGFCLRLRRSATISVAPLGLH
ncbi:hypothetical protein RZS08_11600, partial [Arthrospira platensis SPKY1]|nr:hypothetical protein [Arthrospira platensis SPKY1]